MAQEATPLSVSKKTGAERPHRKEPRWARLKEVCERYRCSPATWWRWTKYREGFPAPYKPGPRITCWDLNQTDAFFDAQQKLK